MVNSFWKLLNIRRYPMITITKREPDTAAKDLYTIEISKVNSPEQALQEFKMLLEQKVVKSKEIHAVRIHYSPAEPHIPPLCFITYRGDEILLGGVLPRHGFKDALKLAEFPPSLYEGKYE